MINHIVSDTQSEITHLLAESEFIAGIPHVHHVIYRTIVTDNKKVPVVYGAWIFDNSTCKKVKEFDQSGIVFEGRLYTHVFVQWLD
jgi:hypothetical protein